MCTRLLAPLVYETVPDLPCLVNLRLENGVSWDNPPHLNLNTAKLAPLSLLPH